jgi:DNA-binding NtrC family response regulator
MKSAYLPDALPLLAVEKTERPDSRQYRQTLREKSTAETRPVLAVLREHADALALGTVLEGSGWRLAMASCYRAAMDHLRIRRIPVIITDERLADGDSMDILSRIAPILNPPRVIVASTLADSRLWSEVLHLGGYDMLVKPFQRSEVLHAVDSAVRAWRDYREPQRKLVGRSGEPAGRSIRVRAAGAGN